MTKEKRAGANIGGMYLWTQRDFNALMNQLSTMQATVNSHANKLSAIQTAQNVLQGNLQALQTNVLASLAKLSAQEATEMSALDDLKSAVEQTQSVEQSAVTLIQGIAKQLSDALANNQAANNDPALAQLRDQLNSSAAELGAAVAAGTPADPNAPQVSPLASQHR